MVYPCKKDNSGTDHSKYLQEDKSNQVHLPAIHNKVPQQKASTGTENINGELKPKARRRWGHLARPVKNSEEWDDLEDLDFSSSVTRVDLKNKKRQNDETICRFESILDLKPLDAVGSGSSAPSHALFPRQDTPTLHVSAAKQHYLRHSRYLPGVNTRNNVVSTSSKEVPSNPWPSSGLPGKASVLGGSINRINSGPIGSNGLTGGYIPSFMKKEAGCAGQRVQLAPIADPSSNYAPLTSAKPHLGRPPFNSPSKSTPGVTQLPPPAQPIHGRIDWSAKYRAQR